MSNLSWRASADVRRRQAPLAAAVDSIVAEYIAKFPDNNLSEAIQRAPGVAVTRDGGEGRILSVRGLSEEFTYSDSASERLSDDFQSGRQYFVGPPYSF